MRFNHSLKPFQGFGLSLRAEYYNAILGQPSLPIDWLEIITENYLISAGKSLYNLDQLTERYPIALHGVSMSIGSPDDLNWSYLNKVKTLSQRVGALWISDHLCWTGIHGNNTHDLLPLPYTEETIDHVVQRIQQIQDFFGQRILLENVGSYINYKQSTLTEWEFLTTVAERADCLILLDINNVFISAFNHKFNPIDYINAIPRRRVQQIHLAGHNENDNYVLDTEDQSVILPVWDLYKSAIQRFGSIATLIERDDNMPPLSELITEVERARHICHRTAKEDAA